MSYVPERLRFGAFIAPFHGLAENPTVALERDMELVQLLDRLAYDEAWIGEHHSGGFEIIGSPELFIATVAERTRHIRLGTGVNSLTFHNPLILADRLCQLDHQTRGRIMVGVGPGQLPSDAFMLGIKPTEQRDMMADALDAIVSLLGGEVVTKHAGWFTLDQARLHLLPYQAPRMELAVACSVTPSGPIAAGRHGLSMLSVAASSSAGFTALPDHWRICEQTATAHGHTVHRRNWRVVVPVHVAETREQAFAQASVGAMDNVAAYIRSIGGSALAPLLDGAETGEDVLRIWSTTGLANFGVLAIGTPDDVTARIEELLAQSGGFGTFLMLAHNAADWAATQRSYELFARYVMPRFQHSDRRRQSIAWVEENSERFIQAVVQGTQQSVARHADVLKR